MGAMHTRASTLTNPGWTDLRETTYNALERKAFREPLAVAAIRALLELIVGKLLGKFEVEDPDDEQTLLARFDDLRRQGKLTYEEFREIQISLAEQMEQRADQENAKKRNR